MLVAWRIIMPSFSVYRQAATPTPGYPVEGELVLTRTDRRHEVQALLASGLTAARHLPQKLRDAGSCRTRGAAVKDDALYDAASAVYWRPACHPACCLLWSCSASGRVGIGKAASCRRRPLAAICRPFSPQESMTTLG